MLRPPNSLQAFITLIGLYLLTTSCSSKSDKNEALIKVMKESLESSNRAIDASSSQNLHSMEEKSLEPTTKYRAGIWLPKAKKINELSSEIYSYLEKIKNLKEINRESENEISIRLSNFKEELFNVDSLIRKEFYPYSQKVAITKDSLSKREEKNAKQILTQSNSIYNEAMLTKIQNSIKILENKVIIFCNELIGTTGGYNFESYSSIVGQNSNYLKGGDELEIRAGMGTFTRIPEPEIIIDGKKVGIGAEGYALYKIRTPKKPGNYKIPVVLNFKSRLTGKNEIKNILVEYTVARLCD